MTQNVPRLPPPLPLFCLPLSFCFHLSSILWHCSLQSPSCNSTVLGVAQKWFYTAKQDFKPEPLFFTPEKRNFWSHLPYSGCFVLISYNKQKNISPMSCLDFPHRNRTHYFEQFITSNKWILFPVSRRVLWSQCCFIESQNHWGWRGPLSSEEL